jgi:hypothetical protein
MIPAPIRWCALLVLASAFVCGCSSSSGECDPRSESCEYSQTVSVITVAGGEESEDICQSWTLNNPTELWVTSMTQQNGGAYHHANWFYVPDDRFDLPDGTWSCAEYEFDELKAALQGGYLFALSTQSREETQTLPSGGAVRIPPYSRLVGASHVLNASPQTVETAMTLTFTTVPPEDVAASLAPARIEYHDLKIQPLGKSAFTAECNFKDSYEDLIGEDFKYELYYALSHYHELGVYSQLELAGGPRDGEVIFRHDGYGENFGVPLDPPLDIAAAGATGLRFTCGFQNPREEEVRWGIGDQEMCVVALQADTNLGWQGDIAYGTAEALEDGEGGEKRFGGPCSIFGLPWNHNKKGGNGK